MPELNVCRASAPLSPWEAVRDATNSKWMQIHFRAVGPTRVHKTLDGRIHGDLLMWEYGGDPCFRPNLNSILGQKYLSCASAMLVFGLCPRIHENSDPQSISVPEQGPRVSLAVGGVWCGKRKI
ncbi:hypothetical protein C8R43DRAFT_960453 [Mycena crocata]|nr:hypothetical protein C8R43DRAFT_960453 [Mycena crocata]